MKTLQYLTAAFAITFLISSCGGDTETADPIETPETSGLDTVQFLEDLSALETRIESSLDIPKEKDLKEAVTKFQDFAAIFPDDPAAPDYLLRASDLALTIDQPEKSVKILNSIIDKYPDYSKMEDVKYNRASHLDFELRDTTRAKEAYQDFMDDYPTSPLVSDCESRIKNIRYSMEELTEKFMKELESGGAESASAP